MSIVLILIGLVVIYWSVRVIARIDDAKVNRKFKSSVSERLSKENAASYRVVNGVLFALASLLAGILLTIAGVIKLFV